MGKKHKKHHRKDDALMPKNDEVKPLRLVLKVGAHGQVSSSNSRATVPTTTPLSASPHPSGTSIDKKKKKKKKKTTTAELSPLSSKQQLQYFVQQQKQQQQQHKHHKSKHKRRALELNTVESTLVRPSHGDSSLKLHMPPPAAPPTSLPTEFGQILSPTEMLATNRPDRMKDKKLKADLLRYLFALQRKDVHKFFAMPVSDSFAPGYSRIIKRPMDFKRLRTKVEKSQYNSVDEFKDDVELMCVNCTVYNGRDTIYYKEAVKLLAHAIRLMKNDLSPAKQVMPSSLSLSGAKSSLTRSLRGVEEEVNVTDVDWNADSRLWLNFSGSKNYGLLDPCESATPNAEENAETIARHAAQMARDARARVEERGNKMGTLHCADDGSTRLTFLNPDAAEKENSSVPLRLGSVAGVLQQGKLRIATAPTGAEKANKVLPVSYLLCGPFSSFAPLSSSNEESFASSSDLVTAYGDATGVQYAESLQRFVEGSSSHARAVVEELLNSLTDKKHAAVAKKKVSVSPSSTEKATGPSASELENSGDGGDVKIDVDSLLTLEKEGIDVSFLSDFAKSVSASSLSAELMQCNLDENARRLESLQDVQTARLGASQTGEGSGLAALTSGEKELGLKIAKTLTDAVAKVDPKCVVPTEGIQLALGLRDETESKPSGEFSLLKQLGLDSDDDE